MSEFKHTESGVSFGISQIGIPQYKFYTRNGKEFLRNYKRPVKGGLTIIDLQRIMNARMNRLLADNLQTNVYSSKTFKIDMQLPKKLYFHEDNACIYEIINSPPYTAEVLVAEFNKTDYGRRLARNIIDLYNSFQDT